ncbi:fibronectin type III domain-containing protein [Micromonospora echinofusca]|uniref:Fibronectin type-III domain-containing protein n=1 Tax=Micromonospora echinofusca TaxID=47858 RepID=A0ABS3VMP8_MICEH|nr:fibronectin type III domain-containing protein [Micromonospora echinofusca]MBO4205654.1 hypothetical protein [Micromonospora echinofusca]
MRRSTTWRRRAATLAVAVLAGSLLSVTGPDSDQARAALPTGGMTASAINTMFNTYGDAGGHWTGADATASVPLPDGRLVWLFSDTFLGTVNPDGSRARDTPMVNNTMVVQDGTSLVSTRHGGTTALPEALVKPAQQGEYFWVADGTVENGSLKVLYNRYRHSGTGNLDFELTGNALVTFALPALTVSSVVDLPLGSTIGWGSAILEDGAYTYVYGTSSSADKLKFAHLARVPAGGLGGAWQFWTGSGWSATEADAARILSGVGTNFGMQKVGSQYVLITHENNLVFDPQYVAYTAPAASGPFTGPAQLFTAPEQEPGKPIITYDARLHPVLARSGKLLVSYNVNSLVNDDNYTDARLYRPRFVEVDWPRPAPDPATLPAAPAGFTAAVDNSGIARLGWQSVPGATGYRVHRRDTTAGQTHFARLPSAVTGTSTQVGHLTDGHRYEFKVTAENTVGEGPASPVLAVVPEIVAPPAPANVTATADAAGRITLTWSAVPTVWNYEVFRRDVTAADDEFTFVTRLGPDVVSHVMEGLEHNHEYEFHVTAHHGGGVSPPSALARATAVYTLPGAPTNLTATPNTSDGTIRLTWTEPGPNVWYLVYQRDVTAGHTEFHQLPLPVTVGTSLTASFLIHNHVYEFKVSATNRAGEGPTTPVVSATATYPKPAAPTGLVATAGDGQVTLSWTASTTPNVWYDVYQRNVTAGETSLTKLPLPITTCCTMQAALLTNGDTYEFKVVSTSQGGASTTGPTVQATPRLPLPGQVTGLSTTSNSNGTIRVSWTAPGENLWFDVYQRDVTAGQTTFTKLALPVTECCTFTAGALTHNHVYEFKIAATNASGAGPLSAPVQGTSRYSLPTAPTNMRAESAGDGMIALDWDAPTADGYLYWIYYRDATAGQGFTKGIWPTERTWAELGPYVHGHVYEFKVAAENQAGYGPTSAVVQVTAKGGLPAAPTGLTATAGNGQATLSWTASTTGNVTYNVYQRNASANGSWQKLALPVTGTSMTAAYLANGSTYEFKVSASNASGTGGFSNVASARPMPPPPSPASGLTATPGDGKVTLRWTASPTPNVSYWVELRSNGGSWRRLPVALSTCCTYTVNILTNGITYDFRLFAVNITSESGASNIASARPMPPTPQAPTGLTATPGDGKAYLSWTASPTPNVGYWVELRSYGGNWQRLPVALSSCCTYTVEMLWNGRPYDFRLFATNLAGDSLPSNTAKVTPMPPFPDAPRLHTPLGSTGKVNLAWDHSTTNGAWYWIYYRNASRGQVLWSKLSNPTDKPYAVLWGMFTAGDAYDFKVTAYNVAGENDSNVEMGVPHRFLPSGDPTRWKNHLNRANLMAGSYAYTKGMSCQNDYKQIVCFGPPPNLTGQPMTVGDYFFYPGNAAGLEIEVAEETMRRAQMRRYYGASIANSKGPDLLRHEAIHSEQWADVSSWGTFAEDYAAQSAYSEATTGSPACNNIYEMQANLFWGGYSRYPSGGSCN